MEKIENKSNNESKKPKKIGKYDYVEKPDTLGFFEPELINKLSTYCTLVKTDRTNYITELLKKELDGLTLTNDFLTLNKTYYFNYKELYSKSRTKAVIELPLADLEDYDELTVIPNNLDKFNDNFKTYCHERRETHLGLDLIVVPTELMKDGSEIDNDLKVMYLIFRDISNKIEMGLIDPLMIDKFIDITEYSEVFQDLKRIKEELENYIIEGDINSLKYISKPYCTELYLKQQAYDTVDKIMDAIMEISKVGLKRIKLVESEEHNRLIEKYEEIRIKENDLDGLLKNFKIKYSRSKLKMDKDEFKKIESELNSEKEELLKNSELLKMEKSELTARMDVFIKKYNEIVDDYVHQGNIITKNLLYFTELDNRWSGEIVSKKDVMTIINLIGEYVEPFNTEYPIDIDSELSDPISLIESRFKEYLNESDLEFFDKVLIFVKKGTVLIKEEEIDLLEDIISYER